MIFLGIYGKLECDEIHNISLNIIEIKSFLNILLFSRKFEMSVSFGEASSFLMFE